MSRGTGNQTWSGCGIGRFPGKLVLDHSNRSYGPMSRGVFVICTMLLVRVGAKHFHPRSPATHPPLQSAPAVLQQTFEARGQQPLTCFLPRYGSGSSSEASLPSLLSPGHPAMGRRDNQSFPLLVDADVNEMTNEINSVCELRHQK
jgi:hypothetical protein